MGMGWIQLNEVVLEKEVSDMEVHWLNETVDGLGNELTASLGNR